MREDIIKEAIDDLEHGIEIGNIVFQMPEDEHIFAILKQSLKKQLPMKPLKQRYVNKELVGVCPSCRLQWDVAFYQRHCSNCGQNLDWS